MFFHVLYQLADQALHFKVSVIGQTFTEVPGMTSNKAKRYCNTVFLLSCFRHHVWNNSTLPYIFYELTLFTLASSGVVNHVTSILAPSYHSVFISFELCFEAESLSLQRRIDIMIILFMMVSIQLRYFS